MEPVTILGVVCNTITLVETGIKIGKLCKQVHDRGSLSENDEVEKWAEEIANDNGELKDVLPTLSTRLRPPDRRYQQLAEESIKITEDLKIMLNKVKLDKRRRPQALTQICRMYFKKPELDKLRMRLQQIEEQIDRKIVRDL